MDHSLAARFAEAGIIKPWVKREPIELDADSIAKIFLSIDDEDNAKIVIELHVVRFEDMLEFFGLARD